MLTNGVNEHLKGVQGPLSPLESVVVPSCDVSGAWKKLICFAWMSTLFPGKALLTGTME